MIRAPALMWPATAGAALLWRRAVTVADFVPPSDRLSFTRAVAELFLADGHEALMTAADAVTRLLETSRQLSPRTYARTLFLLGWCELRLRRDPAGAVRLLQSAIREAESVGAELVVHRARANLSFALAFGGQFAAAEQLIESIAQPLHNTGDWQSYDGGIESMATGYLAFWRNDLDRSAFSLRQVVDGGGGEASYAALARVYLAFVACARGDRQEQHAAERALQMVSDVPQHGVPWTCTSCPLTASWRRHADALSRSLRSPEGSPIRATCRSPRSCSPRRCVALAITLGPRRCWTASNTPRSRGTSGPTRY